MTLFLHSDKRVGIQKEATLMKTTKRNFVSRILIFASLYALASPVAAQSLSHRLIVVLEDAPFENLSLLDYTRDRTISIDGKQTDKDSWEFIVPDSIAADSDAMSLRVSKYDSVNNSISLLRFTSEMDHDVNLTSNVGLEDNLTYIYARFKEKSINPDQYIILTTKNKEDTAIIADIIRYDFTLLPQNKVDSDIMVRINAKDFSSFEEENQSYEEQFTSYLHTAKQYPNSKFLITRLANSLTTYQSKQDVQRLYDQLSDKHKDSFWAAQIERYIGSKFINERLPALYTNAEEKIVRDSTKYNLIVFTASWCAPCMEEIPLLKTINTDLGEQLNITYITIDREQEIPNFQKVVEEHTIPWPSLLAFKNVQRIREKFFVPSIPHCVLISPEMDMEVLDIRKEEDRQQLYNKLSI